MKRLGILVSISIYMCLFSSFVFGAVSSRQGAFTKSASDVLDFRNKRKLGIGLGAAGPYGMVGTSLELNFSPHVSLATQFGLSDIFQSFGLSMKRIIAGQSFAPYISGGFTRWYTVRDQGTVTKTNPGFLAKKFLTNDEKLRGEFAKTLIYPALGIQYLQLAGDWAGTSLYAEVLMLVDFESFKSAPTGSLGINYYF